MRLHKLKIYCHDKKEADLLGDENATNKLTDCYIDLSLISFIWSDPDDNSIHMNIDGADLCSPDYTLDEFYKLWFE